MKNVVVVVVKPPSWAMIQQLEKNCVLSVTMKL
jgi:hypothetical protein